MRTCRQMVRESREGLCRETGVARIHGLRIVVSGASEGKESARDASAEARGGGGTGRLEWAAVRALRGRERSLVGGRRALVLQGSKEGVRSW